MIIFQISDLHFGCRDEVVTQALEDHIREAKPDLVLISGDVTQSALESEFIEAREFIDRLDPPVFVIPGNHDLPGMDLMRFINPFGRYKRYISEDMEPEFVSPMVHIKGINTARMILPSINWAWGSVSRRQAREVERLFKASTSRWKILTLHHPLTTSKDFPLDHSLFHADRLRQAVQEAKVDMVLAGHQHHASFENSEAGGHMTLYINASTTISQRLRRQPNGFNRIELTQDHARIDHLEYDGTIFRTKEAEMLTHPLLRGKPKP